MQPQNVVIQKCFASQSTATYTVLADKVSAEGALVSDIQSLTTCIS